MDRKTIIITGAGKGIGLAIALRFAREGWNVVIATKDKPDIMDTAVKEILSAGGKALPLLVDVSDVKALQEVASKAASHFGGIDVLVNNTSATCFADTLNTTPDQFNILLATSVKAAFFLSQACYPYLQKAKNAHIINISPPLNMEAQWFKDHLAFSIGKFGMSMCTLGMATEFLPSKIAVNSLWPQTTIATQTIINHCISEVYAGSRWPAIMGDAAYEIASKTHQDWTGQFFTDEVILRKVGQTEFSHYAVNTEVPLMQPLFIPLEKGMQAITPEMFLK